MTEEKSQPESVDPPGQVGAVVARFESPSDLLEAARNVRSAGYKRWDTHSPYPIHGMERAMGIRPTILPLLVFGAGLTGMIVALGLQWFTNAYDYPFLISGKPYFSLPANIPVTFELIVLFSAVTAFIGVLMLNRLPEFAHPVFNSDEFRRATTDGFFVSIEAADPKFEEAGTAELLRSLGAVSVDTCRMPNRGRTVPRWVMISGIIVVLLAMVPPLLIARARRVTSDKPRIHVIQDMDFQPKYKAQNASTLFADGRAMRPPVPGTVALGQLDADDRFYLGRDGDAWITTLPIEVDDAAMRRGQERFNIYCATCHGLAGEGGATAMVAKRAMARDDSRWVPPVSLHQDRVIQMSVGELFGVIANGVRSMPSYAAQIPPDDRWKIVLYVRALQRSQNAGTEDVPAEKLPTLR